MRGPLATSAVRIVLGDLEIDTGTRQVLRGGIPLSVGGLSYRLLISLAGAAPNVVSHDTLAQEVWGDVVVSPETLVQRIRLLRRALGDNAIAPRYVTAVRGAGYRLLVAPEPVAPPARSPRKASVDHDVISIAVLPLANLSESTQHAFFADGLTEELSQRLDKIPDVQVISPRSVYAVAHQNVSSREAGELLGADYLLEGSVRWADTRVVVTVRLVATRDGKQHWSESYARELADIFRIQEEIALAVARSLQISFDFGNHRFDDGGTQDLQAYLHYLRGKRTFHRHTPETTEEARVAMESALERDPDFALAWVELTNIHGGRARAPTLTGSALDAMGEAAGNALRLAPEHYQSHVASAWWLMSKRRWVESFEATERARHLARRSGATPGLEFRDLLHQFGYLRESHAEAQLLRRVDPLMSGDFPFSLYALGELDPADWHREGTDGAMRRQHQLALMLQGGDPADISRFLGKTLGPLWETPAFGGALRRMIAPEQVLPRGTLATLGMFAACQDDTETALDCLRAEYLRDGFGAFFLIWHPAYRAVRRLPAFKAFLTDLGLVALWRTTGKWADLCRPVGENDFVCR